MQNVPNLLEETFRNTSGVTPLVPNHKLFWETSMLFFGTSGGAGLLPKPMFPMKNLVIGSLIMN